MYGSVAALLRIIRLPAGFTPDVRPDVIRIPKAPYTQRTKLQDIFRSGQTLPPGNDVPDHETSGL